MDGVWRELYRRVVAVHYQLAESPTVDADLHRRTLERLNALLAYVRAIDEQAGGAAPSEGDHAPNGVLGA